MIISGKARLAGVMGWPISHSLSPRLHNHWMQRAGIDGVYIPLPVHPDDLNDVVQSLRKMGFLGFNVTLPFKERMFHLVASADPAAQRMKAVNTVLIDKDGRMTGYNTDGYGFIENLRAQVPEWKPGEHLAARPAVLLGTGGAARAVAFGLIENGIKKLRLVNRTIERAEKLAEEVGGGDVEVVSWDDRHEALADASLCVNCTSLGMIKMPGLDLRLDAAPKDMIVADIVYTPLKTELLAKATKRGHPVVDGLGMLIHQAVPGFRHWGGAEPLIDDETRALMRAV